MKRNCSTLCDKSLSINQVSDEIPVKFGDFKNVVSSSTSQNLSLPIMVNTADQMSCENPPVSKNYIDLCRSNNLDGQMLSVESSLKSLSKILKSYSFKDGLASRKCLSSFKLDSDKCRLKCFSGHENKNSNDRICEANNKGDEGTLGSLYNFDISFSGRTSKAATLHCAGDLIRKLRDEKYELDKRCRSLQDEVKKLRFDIRLVFSYHYLVLHYVIKFIDIM